MAAWNPGQKIKERSQYPWGQESVRPAGSPRALTRMDGWRDRRRSRAGINGIAEPGSSVGARLRDESSSKQEP